MHIKLERLSHAKTLELFPTKLLIGTDKCYDKKCRVFHLKLDNQNIFFSSKECEKRPGCTGFDLTPDEELKNGKERCILFGHDDIEVADSISFHKSRCFR